MSTLHWRTAGKVFCSSSVWSSPTNLTCSWPPVLFSLQNSLLSLLPASADLSLGSQESRAHQVLQVHLAPLETTVSQATLGLADCQDSRDRLACWGERDSKVSSGDADVPQTQMFCQAEKNLEVHVNYVLFGEPLLLLHHYIIGQVEQLTLTRLCLDWPILATYTVRLLTVIVATIVWWVAN